MMGEYIKREEIEDYLTERIDMLDVKAKTVGAEVTDAVIAGVLTAVRNRVRKMPNTDVRENTRGWWVPHMIREGTKWGYDCSECGKWRIVDPSWIGEYKFCPSCGAVMMGGGEIGE